MEISNDVYRIAEQLHARVGGGDRLALLYNQVISCESESSTCDREGKITRNLVKQSHCD
jgi:hypothetical protein